jgi:hypothetical protein
MQVITSPFNQNDGSDSMEGVSRRAISFKKIANEKTHHTYFQLETGCLQSRSRRATRRQSNDTVPTTLDSDDDGVLSDESEEEGLFEEHPLLFNNEDEVGTRTACYENEEGRHNSFSVVPGEEIVLSSSSRTTIKKYDESDKRLSEPYV